MNQSEVITAPLEDGAVRLMENSNNDKKQQRPTLTILLPYREWIGNDDKMYSSPAISVTLQSKGTRQLYDFLDNYFLKEQI